MKNNKERTRCDRCSKWVHFGDLRYPDEGLEHIAVCEKCIKNPPKSGWHQWQISERNRDAIIREMR